MSCGCSSALREDVTQQHSHFPGCSRKWGGTELVSFPQPIFLHPPQFPIAFVFLALQINLFKHFSFAHWTCSSVHGDFSEAVHCCSQGYFPLWGPVAAVSACITGLIYRAMADNVAFDIKQSPWNAVSEYLSPYLLVFLFPSYLQVTAQFWPFLYLISHLTMFFYSFLLFAHLLLILSLFLLTVSHVLLFKQSPWPFDKNLSSLSSGVTTWNPV